MNYSHSHPGLKPFIFLAPFSSHLRPRCWIEGLRCFWLTGGTPGEGAMVTRGSQRRVTELSQLQASRSRRPHRNLKSFRFSTFNPPAHFSHLSSDAAGRHGQETFGWRHRCTARCAHVRVWLCPEMKKDANTGNPNDDITCCCYSQVEK